jgi:hypothetical protein
MIGKTFIALCLIAGLSAPARSAWFTRGDVNGSGNLSITDAIQILKYLFLDGQTAPPCLDAADVDDDGELLSTDGIYLLTYLFLDGKQPPEPFQACGADQTEDELDCGSFEPCSSLGVFFISDKSGSMMQGSKWEFIEGFLTRGISQLSEGDQFATTFYDASLYSYPTTEAPADAGPETREAALEFVNSTGPGGGSCMKMGLFKAFLYASKSTARNKLIFLISDGMTTCPGHDRKTYKEEVLAEVPEENVENIPIHTICLIGGEADQELMSLLSIQSNGTHRTVLITP